jgi:hypothetical protein
LVWCPKCTPASSRSLTVIFMVINVSSDTQAGQMGRLAIE